MTDARPSPSRYVWTALVVGGAILLLALLVVDFESPEIGRTLLAESGGRVGARLEADAFRLNLLRGLEIGGLRARSRQPEGRLQIEADSLRFAHRYLPLIAGRVVVTEATLENPEIRFTRRSRPRSGTDDGKGDRARAAAGRPQRKSQRAAAASSVESPVPGTRSHDRRANLRVESLRLDNAHIVVSAPAASRPTLEISKLDLELRDLVPGSDPANRLLGSTARGRLAAEAVALEETIGRRIRGRLELEAGRLQLLGLEITLPAGRVIAEILEVDLAQSSLPFYLQMQGPSLDSGLLLGAGSDSGMGRASLTFTGSGLAAGSAELDGAGRLELRAGHLPAIPLFTSLDSLLGRTELVGAPYDDFAVPFRVSGDRVLVDSSEVVVGDARLSLSGWADRQGPLALRIVVSAPRDRVRIGELPDSLLDKLTDPQGIASLAFAVSGTRDRPRVVPDLPAMSKRERKQLERALKQEIRDKLRDLVDRNR